MLIGLGHFELRIFAAGLLIVELAVGEPAAVEGSVEGADDICADAFAHAALEVVNERVTGVVNTT